MNAFLPLILQVARGAVPSSPVDLVLDSSIMTKVVLVILAILSLLSWSIMFGVWASLSKAQRTAEKFAREFDRARSLEEATTLAKRTSSGVLPTLFVRAIHFVADARVATQQVRERHTPATGEFAASSSTTLSGSQLETLHLLLETDASDERDRLGRFLPWLATIGSASPLIGLLGTVLGVIDAFLGIASKGSGNLSAVAPGVAEALIATAAALAVAIPATFGYNISRTGSIDSIRAWIASAPR